MSVHNRLILIKYGEISLKGANRGFFVKTLDKNIRIALKGFPGVTINHIQSRITISNVSQSDEAGVVERLAKVFGIVRIALAYETDPDMDSIQEIAAIAVGDSGANSFKVETTRADKRFPLTSPEISAQVGAYVLANAPGLVVDVRNPDFILHIELRKNAYVYYKQVECEAGLPLGTGGDGLVLLSGGIDSPVASYMIARRGMKMHGIHFHSYPYTSLQALEKAKSLAEILAVQNNGFVLYIVNLAKIQEAIAVNCNAPYFTILLRRAMYRIADMLAEQKGIGALVTGESLGQVASQTMEGMACSSAVAKKLILRPLVSFDKMDIVKIAKRIGTFETSILPYEDCCSIFTPKHPQIRPRIDRAQIEEDKIPNYLELLVAAFEEKDMAQFE
ncbi:MAG: tRNA 4-thiouridine(8) synthase ThiI [Eubacteriaceae bacterium]|nr:tRNA 4-thiouridine(8) synthase ThiI [Eubacteriaceae bacterium]